MLDDARRGGSRSFPTICPDCSVPLAVDRTEAEFPEADLFARSGFPSLTIRQILKETAGDSLTISGPSREAVGDESPVNAAHVIKDRLRGWGRTFSTHRDRLLALAGLLTMAGVGVFGFWLTQHPYPPSRVTAPAATPQALAPMSFADGWQRWPDITQGADSSDSRRFATTTYEKNSSVAELWMQWMGASPNDDNAAWDRFSEENPVEYTPNGQKPLLDSTQNIDGQACRVLTAQQDQSGAVRMVPDSWLPTSQPCVVAWNNDGYVILAAGTQSSALSLARDVIASEKGKTAGAGSTSK